MIHENIPVQVEGSLSDTHMTTYILDAWEEIDRLTKRPLILLCPGGAYRFTSDREAEPVALALNQMGFHVIILRYSCAPAVYPAALLEAAYAVKYIRDHAKEWNVDPSQIYIQGFSAGGHLAASLGVFWNRPFLAEALHVNSSYLKPNGLILCYPVITSDENYAHLESMQNLLGDNYQKLRKQMSLECHAGPQVPETFIWHTFSDESVPVENSLRFVNALIKEGIRTEFHMYPVGIHGLSLATENLRKGDGRGVQKECESWIWLLKTWLDRMTAKTN